ncbi:MAG: hypothetical protein HQL91_11440 [Magnetococcales bacterium]|nr:hypothetical protein [Magnetococcales bacterium]
MKIASVPSRLHTLALAAVVAATCTVITPAPAQADGGVTAIALASGFAGMIFGSALENIDHNSKVVHAAPAPTAAAAPVTMAYVAPIKVTYVAPVVYTALPVVYAAPAFVTYTPGVVVK